MAKVGAQRAAELTGRSKSTIQRAMNAGKLSFEIDNNGRRVIDASELDRVFGLIPQDTTAKTTNSTVQAEIQKAADMIEAERLKMRIKALEDQIDMLKEQLEDTKEQRDQWQRQSQQVLLTSQYSQKQAEELKAELQAREEREQARRQQYLAERMKRMQGQNQNAQNGNGAGRPQQRAAQGQPQKAQANNSGAFKGLWEKIKGKEAQKAA